MPGGSLKCLKAVGTITEISVTGVTGSGNISNVVVGPDERLWATTENISGTPVLIAARCYGGTASTYSIGTTGDNFGGIDTDGTYIYVGDSTGTSLFKYSTSGTQVATTGAMTGVSSIAGVRALAGNIYFADISANSSNGQIGQINPNLTGSPTLRSSPTSHGAHGLTVGLDSSGNSCLWFVEGHASPYKVTSMSPTGTFTEYTVTSAPYYACYSPLDGMVYYTARTAGKYGQVNIQTGAATEWTCPEGSTAQPGGIWADPKGYIWVCEENANTIFRFPITSPSTTTSYTIPTSASVPDKIIIAPMDGAMAFTEHDAGKLGLIQA